MWTLKAELPDSPGQPGRHMVLTPKPWVPWDPKTFSICIPSPVCCPKHIAKVFGCARCQGRWPTIGNTLASGLDAAVCFGEVTEARHLLHSLQRHKVLRLVLDVDVDPKVDHSLHQLRRAVKICCRLHPENTNFIYLSIEICLNFVLQRQKEEFDEIMMLVCECVKGTYRLTHSYQLVPKTDNG